jgi:hypothetical protein
MTTPVLGSHTFLETPTVNGVPVLLTGDVASSPIISVLSGSIARQTGTTVIPYDNTAPLSTEGTQIWTQTVTPASTSSRFQFIFSADGGGTNTSRITLALFRGTTCLTSRAVYMTNAAMPMPLVLHWTDAPATVAATTYSLRIGVTSGTWTLNGSAAATYGGANASSWSFTEIT